MTVCGERGAGIEACPSAASGGDCPRAARGGACPCGSQRLERSSPARLMAVGRSSHVRQGEAHPLKMSEPRSPSSLSQTRNKVPAGEEKGVAYMVWIERILAQKRQNRAPAS